MITKHQVDFDVPVSPAQIGHVVPALCLPRHKAHVHLQAPASAVRPFRTSSESWAESTDLPARPDQAYNPIHARCANRQQLLRVVVDAPPNEDKRGIDFACVFAARSNSTTICAETCPAQASQVDTVAAEFLMPYRTVNRFLSSQGFYDHLFLVPEFYASLQFASTETQEIQ